MKVPDYTRISKELLADYGFQILTTNQKRYERDILKRQLQVIEEEIDNLQEETLTCLTAISEALNRPECLRAEPITAAEKAQETHEYCQERRKAYNKQVAYEPTREDYIQNLKELQDGEPEYE